MCGLMSNLSAQNFANKSKSLRLSTSGKPEMITLRLRLLASFIVFRTTVLTSTTVGYALSSLRIPAFRTGAAEMTGSIDTTDALGLVKLFSGFTSDDCPNEGRCSMAADVFTPCILVRSLRRLTNSFCSSIRFSALQNLQALHIHPNSSVSELTSVLLFASIFKHEK
jgi:hypothetical protein